MVSQISIQGVAAAIAEHGGMEDEEWIALKDKEDKRMSVMESNLVERRNVGGQITSRTRSR
jgi:hypothetical protein